AVLWALWRRDYAGGAANEQFTSHLERAAGRLRSAARLTPLHARAEGLTPRSSPELGRFDGRSRRESALGSAPRSRPSCRVVSRRRLCPRHRLLPRRRFFTFPRP